ncbi:MAG TPA: HAD family hydrolase [Gemmataceae bacterium]|nr:HAD family hydrolase [Gemmataceae bacterium]
MTPPAEILNPHVRRGPFRAALFDFDGTLSLIREGWPRVMVGMMVDILRGLKLAEEPDEELWGLVERFVMALNGHPTVVQMARFAEEVRVRGGSPEKPRVYLQEYLDRLMNVVHQRWELLETGRVSPEAWVVPNAHAILRTLAASGVPLFLASGTDLAAVRHEGALLRVLPFFGEHVYAPADDSPGFSKGRVVDAIISTLGIRGDELLGFGDGVVETQELKRAGGVMVGVASAEPGKSGVNADKRDRLAAAGADLIIPDYADQDALVAWLWGEG